MSVILMCRKLPTDPEIEETEHSKADFLISPLDSTNSTHSKTV